MIKISITMLALSYATASYAGNEQKNDDHDDNKTSDHDDNKNHDDNKTSDHDDNKNHDDNKMSDHDDNKKVDHDDRDHGSDHLQLFQQFLNWFRSQPGTTQTGSSSSSSSGTATLSGDVTGPSSATVVSSLGGMSSSLVVAGASAANAATSSNAPNSLMKRDANGNFSAGTMSGNVNGNVVGNLTGNVLGNLTGNVSGNVSGSAASAQNFTGMLSGDVSGSQNQTVVSSVGGVSASNVAAGVNAANAASSGDTAGSIVKRDANGNFSAGTISGNLSGNASSATHATAADTATQADNANTAASANVAATAVDATNAQNAINAVNATNAQNALTATSAMTATTAITATNATTAASAQTANSATSAVTVTGVVGLQNGGTGATSAGDARTNLGLGSAAILNSGTGANNLMQLDAYGRMPMVDGSQLLNTGNGSACCRLSASSTTPITVNDMMAVQTIYLVAFHGNRLPMYDGTNWRLVTVNTVPSVPVPNTANTNFDIFATTSANGIVMSTQDWSDNITRAVPLSLQDGIYVKNGDPTSRYLGTARTTGVAGTTEDSMQNRLIWNYSNRVSRKLKVTDNNTWSYFGGWRPADNSLNNRVTIVVGVQEVEIDLFVSSYSTGSGSDRYVSIGRNVTNAASGDYLAPAVGLGRVGVSSQLDEYPVPGYTFYQWVEYSGDPSGVFTGYQYSAMMGRVDG